MDIKLIEYLKPNDGAFWFRLKTLDERMELIKSLVNKNPKRIIFKSDSYIKVVL